MKYSKHVIAEMELAYAIGMFDGDDAKSFLIGVEKKGPITRFDLDGNKIENVCDGPGGRMTICQVPGRGDQVLATTEFYSPNCGGDDARISVYTRANGEWSETTLCDIPYIHRFGVLFGADGTQYLIACSIKSSCEYKNDWRDPGAVYGAELSGDLARFSAENQLKLTTLAAGQLKNHGFYAAPDRSFALVSTDEGVFKYVPPAQAGAEWTITKLISDPTSDMVPVDFDGDGKDELLTLSPFHGDTVRVYKEGENGWEVIWEDPEKREFMHAIWGGVLAGEKCAVIGHRKGNRDLLRISMKDGEFAYEVIDHDFGPANCWVFSHPDGNDRIIAANRETNQVALYTVTTD